MRKHEKSSLPTTTDTKDFIPFSSTPTSEPLKLTPTIEDYNKQEKKIDRTYNLIYVVLTVCVIAFIGFTIDAWRFHAEAYNEYTKIIDDSRKSEIDSLNKRLDLLNSKLENDATKLTPTPHN